MDTIRSLPPVVVTALVVTYNRRKLLDDCLAAILGQSHAVDRLIVLDNGSTDGTPAVVGAAERADPRVECVRIPDNLGPAVAFHLGFQHAHRTGAAWLWVMDDDVIPSPTALEELVRAYTGTFTSPEELGFLLSVARGPGGGMMNTPQADPRRSETGYSAWNSLLHKGMVAIRKGTFVSVLFPRSTIDAFGYPRRAFGMWGEDIDYTLAVTERRPGYQVGGSQVVHCRGVQKPPGVRYETDPRRWPWLYHYYRNVLYLRRHHEGRLHFIRELIRSVRDLAWALGARPWRWARIGPVLTGTLAGLSWRPADGDPMDVPARDGRTEAGDAVATRERRSAWLS